MRTAAAAQAGLPRPEHCQLGRRGECSAPVELKVADGWGDSAWGCFTHAEEAIFNARSVFVADEEFSGLAAYLNR